MPSNIKPYLDRAVRDRAPSGVLHCVLGQYTLLSKCLGTWVQANLLLGVTLQWTGIPFRRGGGGVEILLVTSCYKNQETPALMGHLVLPYTSKIASPFFEMTRIQIWLPCEKWEIGINCWFLVVLLFFVLNLFIIKQLLVALFPFCVIIPLELCEISEDVNSVGK